MTRMIPTAPSIVCPSARSRPDFSLRRPRRDGRRAGRGRGEYWRSTFPRSPLFWFRAYSQDETATEARFRFGRDYYITGDTGHVDAGHGCVHYAGEAHAISMHKD